MIFLTVQEPANETYKKAIEMCDKVCQKCFGIGWKAGPVHSSNKLGLLKLLHPAFDNSLIAYHPLVTFERVHNNLRAAS